MVPVGAEIEFPKFNNDQLYMHAVDLSNPDLPTELSHWAGAIKELLAHSPTKSGIGYVTIDQSEIKRNNPHRRPGKHIDGNFLGRWWTQSRPKTGGMLMVSDYQACRAWNGDYVGTPGQGGDCSHIDTDHMESFFLNSKQIYLANHAIHESMPVLEDTQRSLLRLTLPPETRVFS